MNDEPIVTPAFEPVSIVDLGPAPTGRVSNETIAVLDPNVELSTERLCSFSGMISCCHVAVRSVQVRISLTNTSHADQGGYLTAFMFRVPREFGSVQVALLRSSHPGMSRIASGTVASPFPGHWQGGAGTGGEWQGGGTPLAGLAPGETGAWAFLVTGNGTAALSAERFMSGGRMPDPYAFVVRFRGMGGGRSDKVPALMPDGQVHRMAELSEAVERMR